MMEDGVTEDQVEAFVAEGQRLGVSRHRLHTEAEPLGVRLQRRQHPGGDICRRRARYRAGLHQVEREVTGARTDLERIAVRPFGPAPKRLAQLARDLLLADLPEVDPPLGVVRGRRHVVVALVHLLDPLRAGHGAGS